MGQITGDLTRVRHGAVTPERLNGAVQTVRGPDGGKGGDVDLNLYRIKYAKDSEQYKQLKTEFFKGRIIDLLTKFG